MRRVEINLTGPEGWAGWRRVLVVRETDTKVLLLQPATGQRLKMRRSAFESAAPRPAPKSEAFIRASLDKLDGADFRNRHNTRLTATGAFKALLAYMRANLKQRYHRVAPWERVR